MASIHWESFLIQNRRNLRCNTTHCIPRRSICHASRTAVTQHDNKSILSISFHAHCRCGDAREDLLD